jgi:hypothetical protein
MLSIIITEIVGAQAGLRVEPKRNRPIPQENERVVPSVKNEYLLMPNRK